MVGPFKNDDYLFGCSDCFRPTNNYLDTSLWRSVVVMFSSSDLKEAFSVYDRNGDGVISAKELTKVMRSMGLNPTESDIMEIMVELDIDGK